MTDERESQMERVTLCCITRQALGLCADETAIGCIDLDGVESALPIWEDIADTLMCEPETAGKHHSVAVAIMRDTRKLRLVQAHLRPGGIRLPVPVTFCQDLLSDAIEPVISCLSSNDALAEPEAIPALVNLLCEMVEAETLEAPRAEAVEPDPAQKVQDDKPEPAQDDGSEDQEEIAMKVHRLNVLEFGDPGQGWCRDDAASFLQATVPEIRRSMTFALDYCREREFVEGGLIETVQFMANDLDELSTICARIIETGEREEFGPCTSPHHFASVVRMCTFVADGSYSSFWTWAIEPRLTALQAQPPEDEPDQDDEPDKMLSLEEAQAHLDSEPLALARVVQSVLDTHERLDEHADNITALGLCLDDRLKVLEAGSRNATPTNGPANWDVPEHGENEQPAVPTDAHA